LFCALMASSPSSAEIDVPPPAASVTHSESFLKLPQTSFGPPGHGCAAVYAGTDDETLQSGVLFVLRDGAAFAPVDGGVSSVVNGDAVPAPGTRTASATTNATQIADEPRRLRGTISFHPGLPPS
jgi:hypothetical protein